MAMVAIVFNTASEGRGISAFVMWEVPQAPGILAILAGIGFGLFFILFHAGSGAGVTAFVSGRVGSAFAALGFALVSGVSPLPKRGTWGLLAVGGTLDGVGVVLYLYATFHGLLSLSALLTSFYPAFTVLCARLFIKERMTAMQAAGAVLPVAAVALFALPLF